MPSSIGVIFSLNVTNIFAVAEKKEKKEKEITSILLKWWIFFWSGEVTYGQKLFYFCFCVKLFCNYGVVINQAKCLKRFYIFRQINCHIAN